MENRGESQKKKTYQGLDRSQSAFAPMARAATE